MKFIVATYGPRHLGMLLAHLHSIRKSHPQAALEVYHQDLPAPQRTALAQAIPEAVWVETHFDFSGDRIQRISSKTLAWEWALRRQPEGEWICLLDVDTLVRRDLQPFFTDADCDVVFTCKTGGFVLNTGVLLCRINARTLAFAGRWREDTLAILGDPARFREANDPRLPYGAADQMALHRLLGYREGQTQYKIELAAERVRLRGESCATLNETRSCPMTEQTHLVHYKGGWQPILLDGRRFSRNRPKAECWEMYLWYLDTFLEALAQLNAAAGRAWQPRDFQLCVPQYVFERTPWRRRLFYGLFVAGDLVRDLVEFARGVRRVLLRNLRR